MAGTKATRGTTATRGTAATRGTTAIEKVRETERKYDAPPDGDLADPGTLLGLDPGRGAEDQRLEAVYFDTADLRLARAGITLRRRTGGSDAGWHLKLPAGPDSRDELRLPLGRATRNPPKALLALTRVHTRGAPVAPVARLNTQRRRWLLADDAGRPLVELVEDQVQARQLGDASDHCTEPVSWREVEVELTPDGPTSLLDRIEHQLAGIGAHRSASGSKLRRLLADRLPSPPEPRPAGKRPTAGAAVLDYLREQADQLRAHDPLVRQDSPDAVHRMRVAGRRMRSALQAYRRVLRRGATRELVAELRWLGRELAPARDSEVQAARFAGQVAELPDELVLGPVAAAIDRMYARRSADGRTRALATLDSDRYLALHDRIDALLADPPLTRRAGRPARRELPGGVARTFWRASARLASVQTTPAGPERDAALHEARKAVKRLRYAAEVAQPAVGTPATRLRKRLKPVQSLLGEHQDSVVARPPLRELAARAPAEGGNGFTFGLMHARESTRAERVEQQLPDRWARLQATKVVGWLPD